VTPRFPGGRRVVTFGTFDVFHAGHLRLLQRAAELGDTLVVGVSSDELNAGKKGRVPVYALAERLAIVSALRCVDEVFVEHSLEAKRSYLVEHRADVLVMGDDWAGRFDEFGDICDVVYLPRTPEVSTTGIIEHIRSEAAGVEPVPTPAVAAERSAPGEWQPAGR
jgi:glycerol-3-phosphate cytidylyltransferase